MTQATGAFTDSVAHLLAEMERIDLLIRYQIAHRYKLQNEDEQFRGLYISDQEVESLLRKPIGMPQWLHQNPGYGLIRQSNWNNSKI